MSDIITGTPADLTYGHWLVQDAWLAVWVVTSAALAFIIGWIGLSLITQEPLGARQAGWRELDFREVAGTLVINGADIETGKGVDVMGHPFEALAFVANGLIEQGRPLRRDMIVMTGSVVGTKWPEPGDEVTVRMEGLGEATVRFG